ncbi:UPF0676 protein [Colletotrichum fructicola]|nr:UPF0676 protein [Colletotrichum fructicola]KAF4924225.1 UPF0676 protein [Colletotrichum fructicola]KAF5490940.1 UPF0676 protein [Colletotrichum fructicola]
MAIDEVLPPMPQFASSIAGKPEIAPWDKPHPTKEDLNWAELRTLDLSLLDGTPNQQAELVETTRLAIQKDGFLFVKNFGMTEEQLDRHFALAQYIFFHGGISEEEKEKFMWDLSKGTFKGYKPRVGWGEKEGQRDQIEHFNWYQSHFDGLPDSVPSNMLPFMDEIQGFADHMTNQVNRRLLVLLSRILGMPDNFLWEKVSARGSAGDSLPGTSYHRHMVYHKWDPEEYDKSSLIMHGHTDFGTLTLLPSQPVSCLQMLNAENEWRWVGYEPGRLLVNLGDALDVISGGQFKATRHKERGLNKNSDVFGAFSRRLDEGLEVPTYQDWKTVRSQGAQAKPEKIVDIDGVKYKEQMFNGTKLLMVI